VGHSAFCNASVVGTSLNAADTDLLKRNLIDCMRLSKYVSEYILSYKEERQNCITKG
jgi:hypothetical protein